MRIDIWSDVVCPWCYIGKRRLEAALATFEGEVDVHWHSFELDPRAPRSNPIPLDQLLARKYGMTLEQARQTREQVTRTAAQDGLEFHLEAAHSGNTFDAHRLIHFARRTGHAGAMKERLLRAYFTEARAIGDHDVLLELAAEVGLDPDATRDALSSDAMAEEVRADEAWARQLGIHGVPFFVFDERFAVSGAQSAEVLLNVLRRTVETAVPAAAACDDEVCEVP